MKNTKALCQTAVVAALYAEAWTTADEAAPSLEERVSVLETLFMGGEL